MHLAVSPTCVHCRSTRRHLLPSLPSPSIARRSARARARLAIDSPSPVEPPEPPAPVCRDAFFPHRDHHPTRLRSTPVCRRLAHDRRSLDRQSLRARQPQTATGFVTPSQVCPDYRPPPPRPPRPARAPHRAPAPRARAAGITYPSGDGAPARHGGRGQRGRTGYALASAARGARRVPALSALSPSTYSYGDWLCASVPKVVTRMVAAGRPPSTRSRDDARTLSSLGSLP